MRPSSFSWLTVYLAILPIDFHRNTAWESLQGVRLCSVAKRQHTCGKIYGMMNWMTLTCHLVNSFCRSLGSAISVASQA